MFPYVLVLLFIGVVQSSNADIEKVHVVFANHLDVGFDGIDPTIGFAVNVINKYFTDFIPTAVNIANQMRQQGKRYIYTTHAWIVSLYLECANLTLFPSPPSLSLKCPSNSDLTQFEAAANRGDITWHAFPFNSQLSFMDASFIELGVALVHDLDVRFNQPLKKTLSQRDVPGITLGALDALNKAGVTAISVGANGGSAPPAVPKAFVWKNTLTGASVIGMWHPGGYGDVHLNDCVTVPGFTQALAFAWRGDNAGPGDTQYVLDMFTIINKEFPNANAFASTFDDFVDELQKVSSTLPVITSEIGDSWMYGVPSDPWKVQMYREIMRINTKYMKDLNLEKKKQLAADYTQFNRLMLKVAEHTWGLDVKTFLHDTGNWSNADFQKWRKEPNYVLMETSWDEQRSYIYDGIKVLGNDPLAKEITDALNSLRVASSPSLAGYKQIQNWKPSMSFACGDWSFQFGSSGGIAFLNDTKSKKLWATDGHVLGEYIYTTFDSGNYETFTDEYCYCAPTVCSKWIPQDFGKPNVQIAKPVKGEWRGTATSLYTYEDTTTCSYYLEVVMSADLHTNYGAPSSIWIQTNFTKTSTSLPISFNFFVYDKTPTRLPEAHWIGFHPIIPQNSSPISKTGFSAPSDGSWWVNKCGQLINPLDVVMNGSMHIHGQLDGVMYKSESGSTSLLVEGLDISVISLGAPNPFPTPFVIGNPTDGIYFNFYNNIWGTNYVMWYPWRSEDANALYRFKLTLK